jgi:hypothetical protein
LPLTAIPSKFLTIDAISLTAVPSVLHAVAPRRAVCEFPECRKKKKKKKKKREKSPPFRKARLRHEELKTSPAGTVSIAPAALRPAPADARLSSSDLLGNGSAATPVSG